MNTELFGQVSSLMRVSRATLHSAARLKVFFIRTASDGWRSYWPL